MSDIVIVIAFSLLLRASTRSVIDLPVLLMMFSKVFLFFGVTIFLGFKLQKHANKFLQNKGFTLTLIVALALGLLAESIGLHMIIGAFLGGLFIRQELVDEEVFNKIEDRIYGLSYSFLGPIFFVSIAFHLNFSGFLQSPLLLISLFLIAFLGKFFGSALTAKLQKISFKRSVMIGLAMNSRGAVDLIIASLGLQQGIITKEVFSILVIISFAATLLAIFLMRPLVALCRQTSNP